MMRTKLTVCSSLLYHWIRLHQSSKNPIPFNKENFQAWTGEFLEHAVSLSDVDAALAQLTQLNLISSDGETVQLKSEQSRAGLTIPPLPQFLVRVQSGKSWLVGAVVMVSLVAIWFGSFAIHQRSPEQSPEGTTNESVELDSYPAPEDNRTGENLDE